jgi:hypothetical protein
VDEQDCGKHHARFNRHHEIENYREKQRSSRGPVRRCAASD